ncbi:unnamed protein product, partial [Porites lobata]
IAIAAVSILFSITASLGNILILIALRKATSIHPPTKLLFQCLATTDLDVGLISQPLMATLILLVDNIDFKIRKVLSSYLWSLSIAFCGVSVFTSTALILNLTATLLFVNSSLNPFLYCWRIKEIRQAVKATIKR